MSVLELKTLSKLYLDTGTLVWNGNSVTGADAIQAFLETLPTSEHTVICVDAQAVSSAAVDAQTTVLIVVSGQVRLKNTTRSFQQHFMLTAQERKWKVVTDCFRFQELVS
ncbi:NTF2-related export protein 1 [Amphibalanus amphitrite]|uniref:NTF2-related export protein n=1 Tax=Amphibalanus amphitrite TaxID=1232801 RepID=A0A6A4WHM5_AMPAM|nr:NTF2-related export protein 1 [Amphibalanus amphitrite]KAF0310811.1 NTF2-related export protein 1 [Amphibalanus amphitrite]